jgi:hypothetical protein
MKPFLVARLPTIETCHFISALIRGEFQILMMRLRDCGSLSLVRELQVLRNLGLNLGLEISAELL